MDRSWCDRPLSSASRAVSSSRVSPWALGAGVGEQDMGLGGGQADLLHRRPGGAAGPGDGDEPLGLGEVPGAAVGEGELLVGD